jgi:hypothetical protein
MTNEPQLWYGTQKPRKQRNEGARKVNAAQQEKMKDMYAVRWACSGQKRKL